MPRVEQDKEVQESVDTAENVIDALDKQDAESQDESQEETLETEVETEDVEETEEEYLPDDLVRTARSMGIPDEVLEGFADVEAAERFVAFQKTRQPAQPQDPQPAQEPTKSTTDEPDVDWDKMWKTLEEEDIDESIINTQKQMFEYFRAREEQRDAELQGLRSWRQEQELHEAVLEVKDVAKDYGDVSDDDAVRVLTVAGELFNTYQKMGNQKTWEDVLKSAAELELKGKPKRVPLKGRKKLSKPSRNKKQTKTVLKEQKAPSPEEALEFIHNYRKERDLF